ATFAPSSSSSSSSSFSNSLFKQKLLITGLAISILLQGRKGNVFAIRIYCFADVDPTTQAEAYLALQ
ncbi:hypothetical protein HAX54_012260, partial [Datura stramonium]|nr:hypothetical protein [Datura stramonium]